MVRSSAGFVAGTVGSSNRGSDTGSYGKVSIDLLRHACEETDNIKLQFTQLSLHTILLIERKLI
jgi:hypothetical protein